MGCRKRPPTQKKISLSHSFTSWDPKCLLLWPGRPAQYPRHRLVRTQPRGSLRCMPTEILGQDGGDGSKTDGRCHSHKPLTLVLNLPNSYLESKRYMRKISSTVTSSPTISSLAVQTPNQQMSFTLSTLVWRNSIVIQRPSNTYHIERESLSPGPLDT